MRHLPAGLVALAKYNQFMIYKKIPSVSRPGKTDKVPVSTTGVKINAHDPKNWMTADEVLKLLPYFDDSYGLGFVLSDSDPFFFVDVDACLNGGKWSSVALDLCTMLTGAAVEVSQSGHGLHIIGTATTVDHACTSKLNIELYTQKRLISLTGINVVGSVLHDCNAVFSQVVTKYFPPSESVTYDNWTDKPIDDWYGLDDDDTLIAKALKSKSTFGRRAPFAALWECDEEVLAKSYPSGIDSINSYDHSVADAALAQHLAFWTGKNCERILQLMQRSALAREKWEREKYINDTILRAVAMQEQVYNSGRKSLTEVSGPCVTTPQIVTGYQFLDATRQVEHFNGCVYILDMHCIFTPNGSILRCEQFNAIYGGYTFQLESDAANGRTTRKAWEAFTESQAIRFPKVDSTCFRPEMRPGEIFKTSGQMLVNVYVPIETPRKRGDPTPFLVHLGKVLPNKTDRIILLSYMAACIQYKGTKFQWAPLLQGVEGNGKTLFTDCVAFAIGDRYVHKPPAHEISEKYNLWLFNTLFIGIEDIYVPSHKFETIEILKPMITARRMACRAMRTDQYMGDVRCNFMFNSNHKDGILKTLNDRHYCVFYSAQQKLEDLAKWGMGGNYFPALYDWLRADGYAIVADYLADYVILDKYNPATLCQRPPETSSTSEAVAISMGTIEQEIEEAVAEGQMGFRGGWISSMALDRLLKTVRGAGNMAHRKRREMLQTLGYDWHPALPNGRAHNAVSIDGGKPRLFIKDGHIHANLRSGAEIVKRYEEAQNATVVKAPSTASSFVHT